MQTRLIIGDRFGEVLAELDAQLDNVSWRLNEVSKINFSLPRNDPKAIEQFLRVGNRVVVLFDNGLPMWGGTIELPRDWDNASVTCTALSAENLLNYKITDKGRYFDGQTVGYIFRALVDEANLKEQARIELGEVWYGGEIHYPEYHFDNILKIIQDSLCEKLSTSDFDIKPTIVNNKIIFTANFYERKGKDKEKIILIEGSNLNSIKLSEQGIIINSWDLAGRGNNWGIERITSHAEDIPSIGKYGLRQSSQIKSDTSEQQTLDNVANSLLLDSKKSKNMLDLSALDLPPANFIDYDIGDKVRAQLFNYGFQGYDHLVRILAREVNIISGIARLIVQEE